MPAARRRCRRFILQAQPLIAFEAGSGTRDLIDRWFRSAGLAVTPVMQLGSIEAIKRMVRAGWASIVPCMAVERVEDRDGLRVHCWRRGYTDSWR